MNAGFSDTMTTLSMAIPSSAVPGTYRMRVLGVYNGDSGGGLSALYPMRPCNLDENDSTVYKYGKTLDFFVEIAEDPLPVKLGRFTAIAKAGAVYLEWTTFSETENKGFYIERSPDGKAWSVLGFVKGKAGMTPLDYNYMDSSPLAGLNIYRLRQMDFNGGIDYSPVIKIVLDEKGKDDILVYPNPATRYITVEGLRGNERISLFNASGSLILQRQAGAGKELMDLLPLDSGVYFLQVSDIYGRRKMKQVMKQGE